MKSTLKPDEPLLLTLEKDNDGFWNLTLDGFALEHFCATLVP